MCEEVKMTKTGSSLVPEWQERWVKIKYDLVEKQQVGQPKEERCRLVQTTAQCFSAGKLSFRFSFVIMGILLTHRVFIWGKLISF